MYLMANVLNGVCLLFPKASSVPRPSANAKSSSTKAGKGDGHHLKQPPQSSGRKVKQPRQQEDRHSRTSSKKIPLHRSKPRSRKGIVQLLNKPKEESKETIKDVEDKTKQLSHVVIPTTCTPKTHSTSTTSSHHTTNSTAISNTYNVTADNKLRTSSATKATPVNGGTSEAESLQGQPTMSVSSIPQPLYYPNGSHLQQLPYYVPAYQPHPQVHLQYPYHPYRYSSVPVYVADVTRRYNEMYGHPNGISGVYGGQHYRQHFSGVPQVCNASAQPSSHLPSSGVGDGAGSKVHLNDGVKAASEGMLITEGKTNGVGKEEEEEVATNVKQFAIVQGLLNVLKKRLEGM